MAPQVLCDKDKPELTNTEKIAKQFFIQVHTKAVRIPCSFPPEDFGLPPWYDVRKFERGRRFFNENSFGILVSNLFSIASFLSISKDLNILIETGKINTPQKARNRYINTLIYTVLWYNNDIAPGSKSFETLKKVRKAHFYASERAKSKGISPTTVADLSVTAFAFTGYVVNKSQHFGINEDREGHEGFLHMWAVYSYMLGVEDEFNMCLLPYDSFVIYCDMIMRYILIPLIQVESPDYRRMVTAYVEGLQRYAPTMSYEVIMFGTKQLLEIPGYQQGLDKSKEVLCRSLLSQEELNLCTEMIRKYDKSHEFFLFRDIPVFGVVTESNERKTDRFVKQFKNNIVVNDKCNAVSADCIEKLRRQMDLSDNQGLMIEFIRYEEEWLSNMNDGKYQEMSRNAKMKYNMNNVIYQLYVYSIVKYVRAWLLDIFLNNVM